MCYPWFKVGLYDDISIDINMSIWLSYDVYAGDISMKKSDSIKIWGWGMGSQTDKTLYGSGSHISQTMQSNDILCIA